VGGVSLSFLTPFAGLVALAGIVPLVALVRARVRARRMRREIGLAEPARRTQVFPAVALAVAAVFVGAAAMQPVVSLDEQRRAMLRRDWTAYFDQFRNGGGVSQPRPYLLVLGARKEQS